MRTTLIAPHMLAECMRGLTLNCDAQVGIHATIRLSVTTAEYAVMSAGAVVTLDVPPRALVLEISGHIIKRFEALTCVTGAVSAGVPY
jgi:acetyltransferase-like isoleucine patch superfamily enzyme